MKRQYFGGTLLANNWRIVLFVEKNGFWWVQIIVSRSVEVTVKLGAMLGFPSE
jgi:hypothetical protein